jgi:hypothetical protein
MREYGTCLICLDQHISKLSDTVKGNSACHIAFQQQLPQDVYDVSSIMQILEKKEIFSQLPVGYAIVKLSERHTSPFLIKVPYTDLRNSTISDEKIKNKMDCVIQGIEVEKSDPEFREALIGENLEKREHIQGKEPGINTGILEIPKEKDISGNLKSPTKIGNLTSVQEVLYDFIFKQISKGKSIKESEKMLEEGLSEKLYKEADIFLASNYALEQEMNRNPLKSLNYPIKFNQPNEKPATLIEIENNNLDKNLSEEENFIDFLRKNPSHNNSTVEIYKKIGLSTRKGNILKNKLLSKGLIKIQEERSQKGWKKIIRLNPSNKTSQ